LIPYQPAILTVDQFNLAKRSIDMTELEPLEMTFFGSLQDDNDAFALCELEGFSAATSKFTSTKDKADSDDLV
jgi:hypothetical protein